MPDFNEFRDYLYDDFEFREDSDTGLGVVTGTIVKYGDVATFPWGTEEVKAGAYGKLDGVDLYANRMHVRQQPLGSTLNGRVKVTDSPEALRGEVRLPDTSSGRDTAYEVADKILRGLSKEFRGVRDSFPKENHRVIEEARLFGFGVVDRPAYPQSGATMRNWQEYIEMRGGLLAPVTSPLKPEPESDLRLADVPEWARQSTYLDHKGRLIFIGGDLDCRYEDYDVEERQMPRLRGRLPYGVDGVTSMARNEHVRFLPGAFAASLDGEILALVGGDYDNPLGGTAQRSLSLIDTEAGVDFSTSRIPETSVNRDFITKLRSGFVRGVTAGWALLGSDTTTEAIPGGGTRIVVRKAMLCELRFRTRSAFVGESITASPRRREAIRFQVA